MDKMFSDLSTALIVSMLIVSVIKSIVDTPLRPNNFLWLYSKQETIWELIMESLFDDCIR